MQAHTRYCLNTAANCNSPAAWLSTGSGTSISPAGLTPGLTYYWQVRAINPIGATYANGGSLTTGWFSLTVLPLPRRIQQGKSSEPCLEST